MGVYESGCNPLWPMGHWVRTATAADYERLKVHELDTSHHFSLLVHFIQFIFAS